MPNGFFAALEAVAPGFADCVEHAELLAAPDLEREFGLTGATSSTVR